MGFNSKNAAKLLFLALFCIFSTYNVSFANANYNFETNNNQQSADSLRGNVIYVPAGAAVNVVLSNSLNSESTTVGMPVSASLTSDFIYNGKVVAQKGSSLHGTVVKAKKAGFGNRNGQIQVVFNNISTLQGTNIPINGVFKTNDNTGILKGGTKTDAAKDYAKNTVIGAGAGAALGTAMGALSSGSVGKGAIYGTALGGGIGLLKGVSNKGDNVSIPANACLDVLFLQPVTVSMPNNYNYDFGY